MSQPGAGVKSSCPSLAVNEVTPPAIGMESRGRAHSGPLILAIACCALTASFPVASGAQGCDSVVSRTNLAILSGRLINSLTIRNQPPADFPVLARITSRLHSTTRPDVLRRDLLFSVGDVLDTAKVGESLRRLRHRRYLVDANLSAYDCGGHNPVDLVLTTRDRWTTRPRLTVQSTSSLVGIEEGNILGTGSTGSISLAIREGRIGGSVGYEDLWFLGTSLSTKIRASFYPDGQDVRMRLRTQERTLFEKWRRELIVSRYLSDLQDSRGNFFQSFRRQTALLTFGRRTSVRPDAVDGFLFGVDAELASLNAPDEALVVGPHLVKRNYIGAKIGASRRSVTFDTLTWLVQKQVIVDVPIGIEWEAFAGAGYERVSHQPATFLNGWAGRMWVPTSDALFQVDAWGTGYLIANRRNWEAASLRAQFSSYARAHTGVFSTHVAGETLVNPDPDVRALSNLDITAFVLPRTYRLAEEAYAASVQQTVHLVNPTSSISLDGAFFVAASLRRKSPVSQSDHFGTTVLGLGFRVVPTTPGSGVIRADVMYPVARSSLIPRKPVFVISVAPWLEASRQREDPRLRQ